MRAEARFECKLSKIHCAACLRGRIKNEKNRQSKCTRHDYPYPIPSTKTEASIMKDVSELASVNPPAVRLLFCIRTHGKKSIFSEGKLLIFAKSSALWCYAKFCVRRRGVRKPLPLRPHFCRQQGREALPLSLPLRLPLPLALLAHSLNLVSER